MTRGTGAGSDAGLRGLRRSIGVQSWLVAVVCLLVDVTSFLNAVPDTGVPPAGWAVLAMIVVADAALALPARTSGPVAVLHAVVAVVAVLLLAGTPLVGRAGNAGALIAAYRAGAWMRGIPAVLALVALMLGAWLTTRLLPDVADPPVLVLASTALLPWLVGRYTTARRAYISELEQRAEDERRAGDAAVERAVAAERGAIARDLHDVVSHHVSAIGVHAGAARMGLERASVPAAVTASLSAVETSSRDALHDLRRMLDLLHGDGRGDGTGDGDTSRQPGVANLGELVDGVRRAGPPTRLTTSGTPRPLPEVIDIALYRAVQEMLTNALRHGDGGLVDVDLHYASDRVAVTVRNPVPPETAAPDAGSPGAGRGLTGLRTRATHLGGTVTHGLTHDRRRWQTAVTFPLEAAPR